jgi:hypothetical protein
MLFPLNPISRSVLSDQDSIQNKAVARYPFKISLCVDQAEITDYQVSFLSKLINVVCHIHPISKA